MAGTPKAVVAATGATTTFVLPSSVTRLGLVGRELAAGPDGRLWFTEPDDKTGAQAFWHLGRLTTAGDYSDFEVLEAFYQSGPLSIARGPDGNVWFTRVGSVGRIKSDSSFTEISAPNATLPDSIIPGLGRDLWFIQDRGSFQTDSLPASIARITTDGVLAEFPIGRRVIESNLALGPDGNIWFCSSGGLARLWPTGHLDVYPRIPCAGSSVRAHNLAAGAGGYLWSGPQFLSPEGWRIHRIAPDLTWATFSFIGTTTQTIGQGLDGNPWVLSIDNAFTKIIRVERDGKQTPYVVPGGESEAPPNYGALGIGPDGSLWWSQPDLGIIGRFELDTLLVRPLPIAVAHGVASAIPVAGVFDTDLGTDPSQFLARIEWGDGATSFASAAGTNPYTIVGRHLYAASGTYRVRVIVLDRDGTYGAAIAEAFVS